MASIKDFRQHSVKKDTGYHDCILQHVWDKYNAFGGSDPGTFGGFQRIRLSFFLLLAVISPESGYLGHFKLFGNVSRIAFFKSSSRAVGARHSTVCSLPDTGRTPHPSVSVGAPFAPLSTSVFTRKKPPCSFREMVYDYGISNMTEDQAPSSPSTLRSPSSPSPLPPPPSSSPRCCHSSVLNPTRLCFYVDGQLERTIRGTKDCGQPERGVS